jgi:predicted nucleic acid-binding protein
MRVYLDTHIIDWLLARPEEYGTFIAALEGKALEAVISVEVDYEIDSAPEPQRSALMNLIRSSAIEGAPTYYGIWGETAIPDRMIPASEETIALHDQLAALPGVKNRDPAHIVNAVAEGCTVLVTLDKGMLKKGIAIEDLAGIEIITPDELLARLAAAVQGPARDDSR